MLAEFGAYCPTAALAAACSGTFFPVGDLPTIDFHSASDVAGRRQAGVRGRRHHANALCYRRLVDAGRRSRCPSTPVLRARAVRSYQVHGPSRCSLRKPALLMMASRSSSAVCQPRPDRPDPAAARRAAPASPWRNTVHGLGDHPQRWRRRAAVAGRRRRALVQLSMCLTGSTWRCASSMSPGQSKAGLATGTTTAKKAPASPMLWSTFVGACGTVTRCSGHLIHNRRYSGSARHARVASPARATAESNWWI